VYDSWIYGPPGKRLQIILLDTRYFRSPLKSKKTESDEDYVPNTDPGVTILGEEQWKWLEEQLLIPAQIRIIASSIQVVGSDHGGEKWANFPSERKKLFDLVWNTRVTGTFFISGDMHFAELSMMNGDVGFPIYDLTSSSLNWSDYSWKPLYPNQHRVATMRMGDNFGFIEIDWNRPDPLIRLQIRDVEGDIMIQHKIPVSDLREGTWY
jgi:alkaline phosphatase D